jgi:hypothetical protein
MAVLLGNSEKRSVYKNIELQNLHQNLQDPTHLQYMTYLENNYFIPPGERKYWAHMVSNLLPETANTNLDKGVFNVFPLDLVPLDMTKNTDGASLGRFFFSASTPSLPLTAHCLIRLCCCFRHHQHQSIKTRIGV